MATFSQDAPRKRGRHGCLMGVLALVASYVLVGTIATLVYLAVR